jgi:hypothetical protein
MLFDKLQMLLFKEFGIPLKVCLPPYTSIVNWKLNVFGIILFQLSQWWKRALLKLHLMLSSYWW